MVRDLESVIACTSLLMGLNPRYIRFPDMYSIFDFEIRDGVDEDDPSSGALAELKKELQLAMGDQGEGKKQDGTDNEEELQVQDGDEMPVAVVVLVAKMTRMTMACLSSRERSPQMPRSTRAKNQGRGR